MINFAYGSNMFEEQFRQRCPKSKYLGRAVLRDYRLAFSRKSKIQGGGVADIAPAVGEIVEGVLCEIRPDDIEKLRRAEGVYIGAYEEKPVEVKTLDGKQVSAIAYVVVNKSGPYFPSRQYMRKIIEGAIAHGLSNEYIAKLKAIRTV